MSFHTFQTWNDLATNITLFSFRNRVVDGNIENQKSLQKGTLRFLLQSWIPNLATWSWKKNLENPIFCMSRCEYYELWKDDFQNPRLASSGYMESQSNQHGAWITKLSGIFLSKLSSDNLWSLRLRLDLVFFLRQQFVFMKFGGRSKLPATLWLGIPSDSYSQNIPIYLQLPSHSPAGGNIVWPLITTFKQQNVTNGLPEWQ